jgi:uncharacterized membrane protein YeaQ/YmgE (transglycosylase-associated protein family)
MDKLAFDYPWSAAHPMNLGELSLWLLIATGAGFAARKIVRGRAIFGLWGDVVFAILGVFVVGSLLKAFGITLTGWISDLNLGPLNDVTRWVDIALVAFIGALVLRGILRPITK